MKGWRNANQPAIGRIKAEGFLTAYDIAPDAGLSPATVLNRLGRPCRRYPNSNGTTSPWSTGKVSKEFGWPDG